MTYPYALFNAISETFIEIIVAILCVPSNLLRWVWFKRYAFPNMFIVYSYTLFNVVCNHIWDIHWDGDLIYPWCINQLIKISSGGCGLRGMQLCISKYVHSTHTHINGRETNIIKNITAGETIFSIIFLLAASENCNWSFTRHWKNSVMYVMSSAFIHALGSNTKWHRLHCYCY